MQSEEDHEPKKAEVRAFIARWVPSAAAERSNDETFLSELTDRLGIPRSAPGVRVDAGNAYTFGRTLRLDDGAGNAAPASSTSTAVTAPS